MDNNNVKFSNSTINYEPSFKSRVASVRSKDQSRVTTEQQLLQKIKNKYSAYRSNISNLEDKRFLVGKSKPKHRQHRITKTSSKPRSKQNRARSNRNSEFKYPSQFKRNK